MNEPNGRREAEAGRGLSGEELEFFTSSGGLTLEVADQMRENVTGVIRIPVGLVEGLMVNGRSLDVPLATEE